MNLLIFCSIIVPLLPSFAGDVATNYFLSRGSSNLPLCEVTVPQVTLVTASKIRCVNKCQENLQCKSVNYKEQTKRCDIFYSTINKYFVDNIEFCRNYMIRELNSLKTLPMIHYSFVNIANSCTNPFSEQPGWIVVQRRCSGAVSFYRTWADYQYGFGSFDGEFWIGNEYLYYLTTGRPKQIRFDMVAGGTKYYAVYNSFEIASSASYYYLYISGYSGDAGDAMYYNNNQYFTTYDSEHDPWPGGNCAQHHSGAFWHNQCTYVNVNADYMHPTFQYTTFWYSLTLSQVQISVKYA